MSGPNPPRSILRCNWPLLHSGCWSSESFGDWPTTTQPASPPATKGSDFKTQVLLHFTVYFPSLCHCPRRSGVHGQSLQGGTAYTRVHIADWLLPPLSGVTVLRVSLHILHSLIVSPLLHLQISRTQRKLGFFPSKVNTLSEHIF